MYVCGTSWFHTHVQYVHPCVCYSSTELCVAPQHGALAAGAVRLAIVCSHGRGSTVLLCLTSGATVVYRLFDRFTG